MGSCPTDGLAYGPRPKCSSLVAFRERIFFCHTNMSAWLSWSVLAYHGKLILELINDECPA